MRPEQHKRNPSLRIQAIVVARLISEFKRGPWPSPAITIRQLSDAYGDVTLDLVTNSFSIASQMNVFEILYLIFKLWKMSR